MTRRKREGQVLVLFALMLTVLIGVSALVADIGMKYSLERRYQAIADAAALAGAQQLQPDSRAALVTSTMRDNARRQALKSLADELVPGVAATCSDYTSCPLPGGQYTVSIITPSPNCSSSCSPDRAVQVTVREPGHRTIFAGLFGQPVWPLARTSVAGLSFGTSYTLVALRPPRPRNGNSVEVRDIFLNGGTIVSVTQGDVGSNANMDYGSTTNTLLSLDTGYRMYYYDTTGPDWGLNPAGTQNGVMIADPKYPVPAAPPAPVSPPVAAGTATSACGALVTSKILSQAKYADAASLIIPRDNSNAIEWSKIWCYEPGTYTAQVQDGGTTGRRLTVLKPGLYRFEGGLDINNALVGGYDSNELGVTLTFPRTAQFFQRAGSVIVLNAGSKYLNAGGSEPASAPAMTGGNPSVKMTLIVDWDSQCIVAEPYNLACHDPGSGGGSNSNQTLNLGGGAGIYLAGVQYAPSDNAKFAGNTSSSTGYIGQVWVWTVEYVGSTTVNLQGSGTDRAGQIRIDTACSPGEPPCN